MNRYLLAGAVIITCLCFTISESYACNPPPDIELAPYKQHKPLSIFDTQKVSLYAECESGGPILSWVWSWPSQSYDREQIDVPEYDRSIAKCRFGETGTFWFGVTGYSEWDSGYDNGIVYVFEMDLDISGVSDEDEEDPGGYICVNDDDDNNNSTPDKDETGTVSGEDDLVEISLAYEPSSLNPGYVELNISNNNIKVWSNDEKGTLVIPNGSDYYKRWSIGTQPSTLWVEGYSAGSAELELLYSSSTNPDHPVYPGGGYENRDMVKFTVVGMDLDMSGVVDSDEVSTGGFIALNDNDTDDDDDVDITDGTVAQEQDLHGIQISMSPSLTIGQVKLEATLGSSKIDIWDGIVKGSGHHITLPKTWDLSYQTLPATTWGVEGISSSSSLRDVELKLSYIKDSTTIHSDRIRFTVIDVDFEEDTSQTYGFDDYTDPYYPQKSVKNSDSDTAIAEIEDTSLASSVYFVRTTGTSINVSPSQASSSPQTVTFTGIAEGFSVVWSKLNSSGAYGTDAAVIGVPVYNEDTYTLAVRVVHEEDDDVQVILPGQSGSSATDICVSSGSNGKRDTIKGGDDVYSGENILVGANLRCDTTADNTDDTSTDPYTASTLQNYLNNTIYNQAVVKWTTVTKLPDMSVNFDLNNDGYIDVSSWKTAEMNVVINNCKNDNYNYNIFLVDNPSDGSFGFMDYNQRYGFVHADTSPNAETTTAHELGHGAFGLTHESGLGIPVNIMTQGYQTKWRLFKGQWDDINPTP